MRASRLAIDLENASAYDLGRRSGVMTPVRPYFLHGRRSTMSLVPGFSAHFRPEGKTTSRRRRRQEIVKTKTIGAERPVPRLDSRTLLVYAASISSGLAFSVAWLVTETIFSAILG